jgi:UDP-glucuronate 4-epimerase
MKKVLVTGTGGFIGFHLTTKLLSLGFEVVGIDSLNDYYDPELKFNRLRQLGVEKGSISYNRITRGQKGFSFYQVKLEDKESINGLFETEKFNYVVNLAAQAGVRYSLINPHAYIDANITGFLNILEGCRHYSIEHLVFASSSSVYGLNTTLPFSVHDNVDHPVSLYAASKKANELMGHTYAHLFGLPCSGLRFFTVYGPWGRPDMALFMFTRNILAGKPIDVFNNGEMQRDFTYVDDIVESISRLLPVIPTPDPAFNSAEPDPGSSSAPYRIYNIGNNSPVKLMDFIREIESCLDKKAIINLMPLQPGDVPATFADVHSLFEAIDFKPQTSIKDGIRNFVNWYRDYYKV